MLVTQSCPTLCDPMDCSPPGSSAHGIFQARILECGAISSSRTSPYVTIKHHSFYFFRKDNEGEQRTYFSASPKYGKELLNTPGWTVRSFSSPGGINLPELQTKYQTGNISECWASESVPSDENTSIPGNKWSECWPFVNCLEHL